MEHLINLERFDGVDVGYHSSNIHPSNGEFCVGKAGLDKNLKLEEIIEIAYRIENRPNIIVKAGKNAKWYLKKIPREDIEVEIKNQQWRDTSRCKLYVIEWD